MRNLMFFLAMALPVFLQAQVITDTLSSRRDATCSCVLGDKVFFAGSSAGTDTVDVYDNTTGTWSVVRMRTGKRYPVCRVVNNKAYFFSTGSIYMDPDSVHTIDYYDNNTGSWGTDTIPVFLPVPLLDYDVEVHNQELVFLNETPDSQIWPACLFTLNTQTHVWTVLDTIADSLISSARISIYNDEVMWMGKSSFWTTQYFVHYDLNSGTITLDSFPGQVHYPDVYTAGDRTFIVGGFSANFWNSNLFTIYNHLTDTFAQHSYLLGTPAILRYGNHVFFGGQSYYSGNYTSNSAIGVIYNMASGQLTSVVMSKPRCFYGLTANCGKFILAGGHTYNQNSPITYQDTIDFFDTISYTRTIGEMILARASLRAESVGQQVLFAGGRMGTNTYSDLVEIYSCLNVGEEENTAHNTVVVFPNPAADAVYVQHGQTAGSFRVTDMMGRLVMTGPVTEKQLELQVAVLPPGTYALQLHFDNGTRAIKRFVVSR